MATTNNNQGDKTRALDLALQNIEKQFGKGSIMKLGGGESLYLSLIHI